MITRFKLLNATGLAVAMLCGQAALAQPNVVVTVNQDNGVVTLANTGDPVQFSGYGFRSNNALLDEVAWSELGADQLEAGWFSVPVNEDGIIDSTGIGEVLGPASPGGPVVLLDIPIDPDPENPTTSIDFGAAFDLAAVTTAQAASPLGTDVRDLTFFYVSATGSVEIPADEINYIGDGATNNLVLKVDRGTGNAIIENESPNDVIIDGFEVLSTASLNDAWAGSTELNNAGWQLATPNAAVLAQVLASGSLTIDGTNTSSNNTIDLGDIFVPGSDEDLGFRFLRVGEDDGDGFNGAVEYEGTNVLAGDFNNDGLIDAADYAQWRNNIGNDDSTINNAGVTDGTVDALDYQEWRTAYAALLNPGSGSGAAVIPEPTSIALLSMAGLGIAFRRRVKNS